ncbi:MAG: mechanosensitive ion channel domain-containing protein [Marinobacter sp.]|uniref:mechanosensitive ion channel domain-containing protein n=1 Tax=Marinobacter sp. TaxID=50741 RepID=UPI0034A05088
MPDRIRKHPFFTRILWLLATFLLFFAALPANAEESAPKEQAAETSKPAVQPEIEENASKPLTVELPSASSAGIRHQLQGLRDSLDQRLAALESSKERLAYGESILARLNDEYESFELRLERAGLNLTEDYAQLLRQRLDRLEKQSIADSLITGIRERLSNAREEQLRLEEFEAILGASDEARDQLRRQRAALIRQLHKAITEHIDVLNEYFNTVETLQARIRAYQTLLQQRLFWLPSAETVGPDTAGKLVQAVVWLGNPAHWNTLVDAVKTSFAERRIEIVLLVALLLLLVSRRRVIRESLVASGEAVGNVGKDRFQVTLYALGCSVLLTLPAVMALALGSLLLMEGNDFLTALAGGFTAAAFVTLLLSFVHKVARKDSLGERHFKWNATTLDAIRREIPVLLWVLVPVSILTGALEAPGGTVHRDSLGRLLFIIASIALALFAQHIMTAVRSDVVNHKILRTLHVLAVATPVVLTIGSLLGYHYTAVQLERNIFISICWLAFNVLLYYLCLRALSVRERRLTLERLREQRAAERKQAEAKEAAENSGEGLPPALDMPEMDLEDISQQSKSLFRILACVLAATGLWLLWASVIPALQLFDNITLWTIATGIEGAETLPITLGDFILGLIVIIGTIMAARNLPGTLEVMVLSRMHLEPGSGYAITTIVKYLIVFFGVVAALAVLGVQWSKLQWLVAALGVGLGFGLQEIVANFVSGIILLFERPIRVGDTVTIGGITGTVSRIRIRATTLVDWDRKEQIIPNKTFVTQDLTNWTLSDPIVRVIVYVKVAYGSDVDAVQDILLKVAEDNDRVVADPAPAVFCVGLGDSSIDFEVRVFIEDLLDYMPLAHELHASITRALDEAGVVIPFPQQDINVRSLVESKPTE